MKTLCRTCKRPSVGPHQSWCSYSDGNVAALRASLPASIGALDGDEWYPCADCGTLKCHGECTECEHGNDAECCSTCTWEGMTQAEREAVLAPDPPMTYAAFDALSAKWLGASGLLPVPQGSTALADYEVGPEGFWVHAHADNECGVISVVQGVSYTTAPGTSMLIRPDGTWRLK